eukprot:SAG31_NODE_21142_length_557_cov_0.670306_2_plen_70_part_01
MTARGAGAVRWMIRKRLCEIAVATQGSLTIRHNQANAGRVQSLVEHARSQVVAEKYSLHRPECKTGTPEL